MLIMIQHKLKKTVSSTLKKVLNMIKKIGDHC